MKIAIFSDIHSNLTALRAVLLDMEKQKVEKRFCLGDIVGYGPHPKECLALVKKHADIVVLGNHDEGIFNLETIKDFNWNARRGLSISKDKLTKDDVTYLKSLKTVELIDKPEITLVHGAYSENQSWKYINDEESAYEEIEANPNKICFTGHTHVPFIFGDIHGHYKKPSNSLELGEKEKFVINVGSVGQPRDGDCRASYGILTIENDKYFFEFRRVFYDIQKTASDIINLNLPVFLANRLFKGK